MTFVFCLPLDIVLFWMRWEILSVVRSLTKNAQCTYQELLMNKPLLKIREKELKLL